MSAQDTVTATNYQEVYNKITLAVRIQAELDAGVEFKEGTTLEQAAYLDAMEATNEEGKYNNKGEWVPTPLKTRQAAAQQEARRATEGARLQERYRIVCTPATTTPYNADGRAIIDQDLLGRALHVELEECGWTAGQQRYRFAVLVSNS